MAYRLRANCELCSWQKAKGGRFLLRQAQEEQRQKKFSRFFFGEDEPHSGVFDDVSAMEVYL